MLYKQKRFHYILLFAIVALAFFVRIYHIDMTPSGIYPDEANNGTNAFDAQRTNDYLWFYPDNNGREGLFINLIAFSFKLFGVSILTLKLPSIILGTLTVVGIYFLARELFISRPRIALIAAYATAVSFWAVNFSRIGFRAVMMLPILTFLFYFLFKAFRTHRLCYFAIAGALCGLGFHTYIAYRITPVLVIVLLILLIIQQGIRSFLTRYWRGMVVFAASTLIVFAPMGYTYYTHPEYLSSRTNDISIFAQQDAPFFETLEHTIGLSALQYNVEGDHNWRHNFSPYPLLEPIMGMMFAGGFFTSCILFFLYIFRQYRSNVRNRTFVVHGFLLAWLIGFLAPAFLTVEGLPHALRSIGTLPVVFIFAAYFITVLLERAEKHSPTLFVTTTVLTVSLLIYSGFFDMVKYHVFWATRVEQAQAFNKNLTDMGKFIAAMPSSDERIYVISGPMELLPIKLLAASRTDISYINQDTLADIDTVHPFIAFLPSENTSVIDYLANHADIMVETIHYPLDSSFTMVTSIKKSSL